MNKLAPLAGLRIIESSILGPAAITTAFVDLGAEVIKVESPSGDYIREMTWPIIEGVSLMHYHLNRGKKSITLDLKQEEGITLKSGAVHRLNEIRGDALELKVVFKASSAKEFGLDVLCDKDGANGVRIAVMAESKKLVVGGVVAPFECKEDEDVTLRVFIDKNLVEVFANDRQAAVAAGKYAPAQQGISLFSQGGDVAVKSVQGWKMKSIYAGQ